MSEASGTGYFSPGDHVVLLRDRVPVFRGAVTKCDADGFVVEMRHAWDHDNRIMLTGNGLPDGWELLYDTKAEA